MSKVDLENSIAELKEFQGQAKCQTSQTALRSAISSLQTELDRIPKQMQPVVSMVPDTPVKIATSNITYQSLPSYSWDQNDTFVMIYLMDGLTGIDQIPKEMITCEFNEMSVELRITGLNGRNYRWVRTLYSSIDPSGSKYLIRKDRMTLKLKKTRKGDSWMQLEPDENKGNVPKKTGEEDPSAGLMNLMKDMYMKGDDTMKRTIAEAMMKAQTGQAPNPDDMGQLYFCL